MVGPGERKRGEQAGSFKKVQDDIMKRWEWFNIIYLDLIVIQFVELSEHSELPVRIAELTVRTGLQVHVFDQQTAKNCFDHRTFYQCSEKHIVW